MSATTIPRPNDVLVYSMKTMRWLIEAMCKELTPAELLQRPCTGANCAAWILGHLASTDHWMLSTIQPDVPPLPDGFKQRFSTKGDAPKGTDFGDVGALLPQFLSLRDRLIAATDKLDPARFPEPVNPPNPRFANLWQMLALSGFHTGLHAGHISTIRRSLGKPALF